MAARRRRAPRIACAQTWRRQRPRHPQCTPATRPVPHPFSRHRCPHPARSAFNDGPAHAVLGLMLIGPTRAQSQSTSQIPLRTQIPGTVSSSVWKHLLPLRMHQLRHEPHGGPTRRNRHRDSKLGCFVTIALQNMPRHGQCPSEALRGFYSTPLQLLTTCYSQKCSAQRGRHSAQ